MFFFGGGVGVSYQFKCRSCDVDVVSIDGLLVLVSLCYESES